MLEVIGGAAIFVLAYPANIVVYGIEQPVQIIGWLAIGLVLLFALRRTHRRLGEVWIALWFMPGAIICGAAALLPWPFAVWAHFGPGNCAPVLALLSAAIINGIVVFGVAVAWRHWRRRWGPHNKPLQPIARENARSG